VVAGSIPARLTTPKLLILSIVIALLYQLN